MGSPSMLFAATLCCFAFTVMHIYGEPAALLMLHHPEDPDRIEPRDSWYPRPNLEGFTCIADDDGSALVWSYDGDDLPYAQDFLPKRQASANVRDCGIRGQSSCLAKWDEISEWRVVNSVAKPTGPVLDQRWEDFPSSVRPPWTSKWQYEEMGVANKSSGTVWLSGTHLSKGGFGLLLCEREKPQLGRSVWIQVSQKDDIHVESCTSRAITDDGYLEESECNVDRPIRDRAMAHTGFHGWHTFRLEWNTEQKTIKMFHGNSSESFAEGPMPPWDQVSAVGTMGLQKSESRVKYQFFDYYFTDASNAVISTSGILNSDKTFCAELLLALCPRCKLSVTLMDEDGSDIESWSFSGDKQDPYNGLLAWRLVRLTTSFDSDIPRRLTFKIKTILDGDEGAGEWAIDNFRICQTGKLRVSKTWVKGERSYYFNCYQLSYNGSHEISVNSGRTYKKKNLSIVQKFLNFQNYVTLIGRGGYICRTNECICGRGFIARWTDDCNDDCDDGFYWYSCTKKCGSCRDSKPCVKTTGFCEGGCLRDNMIEPFCKMALNELIVANVRGTTATLIQNVEFSDRDDRPNKLEFQTRELLKAGGESWMNFPAESKDSAGISSSYEARITGLKPSTAYEVRAAVFVGTDLAPTVTFGPTYNFTTTCSETSILTVIPGERSSTIEFDEGGVVGSILGHHFSVQVKDTLSNKVAFSAWATCFPFYVTGLTPFTDYEVKIVDTTTRCALLESRFRTSESVPSEIRNFEVESISDTEVTLRWDPPAPENGVIRRYNVSLKLNELKGCKERNEPTPPEEWKVKIVNERNVFFDGLHPYAKYVVSVTAQTSKPGPQVSLTFETNFAVIPSSMVSNLRITDDKSRVLWDRPADCATITGPTEVTRLFVTRVNDSALIRKDQTAYSYYDLSNLSRLHLEPLTWYKVRVHVVRGYDQPENPDVYQELEWRTNLEVIEAPVVVDVTHSTARIIQIVAATGHDVKVFVAFILREVSSNESFALLPTQTSGVMHGLNVENLKPNALYKVHSLVTVLESDRTMTLNGSPILFETKRLGL